MERTFEYKGVKYQLFVYGERDNYYGQAEISNGGNIYTRLYHPARTVEGAFDGLINNIKEKIDAHRYDVGGEMLVGSVRKCSKPDFDHGGIIHTVYIGRLAFANQKGKEGGTINYYEGDNEEHCYRLLDDAAERFAAKDGFRCIRRN